MAMQTDPVCGMPQVDDEKASTKSQQQGRRSYYFCSAGCKQKFDQQPEQYTGQQSQGSAQAQRGGSQR